MNVQIFNDTTLIVVHSMKLVNIPSIYSLWLKCRNSRIFSDWMQHKKKSNRNKTKLKATQKSNIQKNCFVLTTAAAVVKFKRIHIFFWNAWHFDEILRWYISYLSPFQSHFLFHFYFILINRFSFVAHFFFFFYVKEHFYSKWK